MTLVLSLCALMAGAVLAPSGAAATRAVDPTKQLPGGSGVQLAATPQQAPVPQNCPNREAPPPAVDTSEQPAPGQKPPPPLPVPDTAVGGPRMAECGLVLPVGASQAPPNTQFDSWVLADLDSGAVLAAKDPHERVRPASLVKVLLAMVVVRELKPDSEVTAIQDDANQEGTRVGIVPGGVYTVDVLLKALVMGSGNDVAHALARQLGGVPRALGKMNALARDLGAMDTRAATPSGLDGPGMTTSAYDMALIFRAAMQNQEFADAVATKRIELPPAGGKPGFALVNDNPLLSSYPGDLGGKTGYTDDAQHTYVNAAQRGNARLFLVGMNGSMHPVTEMYKQARPLMDYAFTLKTASGIAPVGQLVQPDDVATVVHTAAGKADAAAGGADTAMSRAFGNVGGPLTALAGLVVVLAGVLWLRKRRRRTTLTRATPSPTAGS